MEPMRSVSIGVWMACFLWLAVSASQAATAVIYTPQESPPGPILAGIRELERVLVNQGWTTRRSFGKLDSGNVALDLRINVIPFRSAAPSSPDLETVRQVVPNEAESYAVHKTISSQGVTLFAVGRDTVGTMYAAYELAEQIERTLEISIGQRIMEVRKSPSIPNRGIQLMLHQQALEDPFSWFHSESFWDGYLRTLSLSRFNYLELQGAYDLMTGEFSNILPYLSVDSGLDAQAVERNLQSLRRITQKAHEYGMTVSLVNSGLDWKGVSPKKNDRALLELTIRSALNRLFQDCPMLDGMGFMVDDSPFPIDFYENTYLKAISESISKPILLIHTWGADSTQVYDLVNNKTERIVLEIKFNGDHLGLPYPVTGGRVCGWSSYSYQDYFRSIRNYGVIFQLPFHGTHRVFPWGDTVFIRRTLENAAFAGANGFVLQTYSTFSPHADAYTNPIRSDLRYFDWTFERDWYWYLLWGRIAYDLGLPHSFFERKFQEHFGHGAGNLLFSALQKASQVVPTLAATCFRAPGMREFAPELEPPQRLEEVFGIQPLDSSTIRSVSDEIAILVTGKWDGRHSPIDLLKTAVEEARQAVELVRQAEPALRENLTNPSNASSLSPNHILKEWNAWLIDFQSLAALGTYWLDQISAAVQLGIYQSTGDVPSLIIASNKSESAGNAWRDLQELTTLHYRPLLDSLRNRQPRFHWKQMPTFENEDRQWITELYNTWLNRTEWPSVSGHFPLSKISASSPALLTLSIPPRISVHSVFVQYQNQQSETARFPMTNSQLEGVYYTELSPKALVEGLFQYFFIGKAEGDQGWVVPVNLPPFLVVVSDDQLPPFCTILEHTKSQVGSRVQVKAKIIDPSGIDSAILWWKPLPSTIEWSRTPMEQNGELFQGSFILPEVGAMYAIEAADLYGNILRFPNMINENPYRIVLPERR